jgi:ribosomal protein L11 methyltransferase
MAWVSLTADVANSEREWVESVMYDWGASGLEIRDGSSLVMPTMRAPAHEAAIVVGYFEARADAEGAEREILEQAPKAACVIDDVQERDWSVEWRSQIKAVTVGRLWVGPPWEKPNAPKEKIHLFIEPKMAFGTGDHPTTSLCLQAVDDYLANHPGVAVLDVGTGTGVLAFAAKKLGSGRTVGIDNDPVAVDLAKECAAENGLEGLELSTHALHDVEGRFGLVLANILANTLIDLAPLISAKVEDRLVLAGVLVPQADEVKAAYERQGLVHAGDVVQGEWIRIDLQRP